MKANTPTPRPSTVGDLAPCVASFFVDRLVELIEELPDRRDLAPGFLLNVHNSTTNCARLMALSRLGDGMSRRLPIVQAPALHQRQCEWPNPQRLPTADQLRTADHRLRAAGRTRI